MCVHYVHTVHTVHTVRTSCIVRMSILVGSESRVLGHRRARPFLGVTAIPRSGKFVSPPIKQKNKKQKIKDKKYT